MRSVIGLTILALIAQAAEQAANNTAADDDADLNELLSNMDDETMDKVADKLIDKLLGNLSGLFNLDGADLNNTELFKLPAGLDQHAMGGSMTEQQPTKEQLEQLEEAAAAEAGISAALAAAAADAAIALAAQFQDAYNNQDLGNQDGSDLLSQLLSLQQNDGEEVAPHAEDVCEGRDFSQEECQAQGEGCCFWEGNACWAAVDGACPVADSEAQPAEEATEELDEVDQEAPDLATVIFVGVASVIVGASVTYALLKPRFGGLTDKQLPLLTPA
jgi:hypothetical protein